MITAPGLGNTDGIPAWAARPRQPGADGGRHRPVDARGAPRDADRRGGADPRQRQGGEGDARSHEAFIDPLTLEPVTAQLYIYDPDAFGGDGRIAVAIGDLDTAAHIAVTVPGLLSDAGGLDPDKSENIYVEARHASGDERGRARLDGLRRPQQQHVADGGIVDQITEALDIAGVVNMSSATDGAEQLASDVAGINAMRGSNDPHLTVVGNSYGSTTSAIAADEFGLEADDLVLSGSPGAGHVRRCRRPDHRPRPHMGGHREHRLRHLPRRDRRVGPGRLDRRRVARASSRWATTRRRMPTAPTACRPSTRSGRRTARSTSQATSTATRTTTTTGSESLYNVASVVAGEYDLVELADPRHKSPFVETHNPVDVDVDTDCWDWTPFDRHRRQMPAEVNQFPVDPESRPDAERRPWTHV